MAARSNSHRVVKRLIAVCLALSASVLWADNNGADNTEADINAVGKGTAADKKTTANKTEKKASTRTGYLLRLNLPLTGDGDNEIKRRIDRILEKLPAAGPRPVLVLQFSARRGKSDQASQFSRAMSLAEYLTSRQLSRIQTVAYLPEPISGHAVLVALACEEIYMDPNAEIGDAGINGKRITPQQTAAYRDIARRRKTVPEAIALGMLDPSLKVLRVELEVSASFILDSELEEISKQQLVKKTKTVIERGQLGRFTGREARQWGFAKRLVDDRESLARSLELSPGMLTEDPSLSDQWRTLLVTLDGPIDRQAVFVAKQTIKEQIEQRNINFICLRIDSPGGSHRQAIELANFLADLQPDQVRTVAYIPSEARGVAAIVAAACDHLVMHPDATLGGEGNRKMNPRDLKVMTDVIRESIAPRKSRSWSLIAALVNPDLEVFRYTRQGQHREQTDYFSEQELNAKKQIIRQQWKRHEAVTSPGEPLKLGGHHALELGLATATVNGFEEFKQRYLLDEDPIEVRPSWAVQLIRGLAEPQFAFILLVVGFAALYAELQMPGMGIGAFVAGVCFLLYFWSHFLSGTAEWLEALLFVAGCACVLLEVFVIPGFGVFGLGGGGLILLSLILASQTFIWPHNRYEFDELRTSIIVVGGALIGCLGLAVLMRRYLPNAPLFSRVMLHPLRDAELEQLHRSEALCDWEFLLGQRGTATTPLALSGRAQFGDEIVQVLSDGDAIDRGTEVVVVEVRGSHVVVRTVEGRS